MFGTKKRIFCPESMWTCITLWALHSTCNSKGFQVSNLHENNSKLHKNVFPRIRRPSVTEERNFAFTNLRIKRCFLQKSECIFFEWKKTFNINLGLETIRSPVGLILGFFLLFNIQLKHLTAKWQSLGFFNQLLIWRSSLGTHDHVTLLRIDLGIQFSLSNQVYCNTT